MNSPQSFLIEYGDGTFNRGCGFKVRNILAATFYPTKEEADFVASHLRGPVKVYDLPTKPTRKQPIPVGPHWVPTPRPTEDQLVTLRTILDDLRDEARTHSCLEKGAQNPDARAIFTALRQTKETQANVMLEVLMNLGADNLPGPLNLDLPSEHHE